MADLDFDLKQWLELEKSQIFQQFHDFGGTRTIRRGSGDFEFLFIPGTRQDRVLLVAHSDTVWDLDPRFPATVAYEDGIFFSQTDGLGIGADDRAGCAILWALRNLGHSLLITSGEEIGCIGSRWIVGNNPDIFNTINNHQFLVQFDRRGSSDFKCYDIGTDQFRAYVQEVTGFSEPDRRSRTDIVVLSQRVCGVNLSVGYYHEHTPSEKLVFQEWSNTLKTAYQWLSGKDLPQFIR